MKKILIAIVVLGLSSCGYTIAVGNSNYNTKIKKGVVHRVITNDYNGWSTTRVRLQDGTILTGGVNEGKIGKDNSQNWDFFFVAPGDTIVYCDDKVLEVKFQD